MLEIKRATPLEGRTLRLTLSDGSVVERDISDIISGPVFERLAADDAYFQRVRVQYGTVTWPGNVDIAPETMIWGNAEPEDETGLRPPPYLRVPVPPR
jgi:Protein of unknown function (DUF2442)